MVVLLLSSLFPHIVAVVIIVHVVGVVVILSVPFLLFVIVAFVFTFSLTLLFGLVVAALCCPCCWWPLLLSLLLFFNGVGHGKLVGESRKDE